MNNDISKKKRKLEASTGQGLITIRNLLKSRNISRLRQDFFAFSAHRLAQNNLFMALSTSMTRVSSLLYLPIKSLCSIHLHHETELNAKSNSIGEFTLHLIETMISNKNDEKENNENLVTFTFDNLEPNTNLFLISFLSVDLKGKIDLNLRVFSSSSSSLSNSEADVIDTNQIMKAYESEKDKKGSGVKITIPLPPPPSSSSSS
jgi:hypothetical protein